MNSYPSFLFLSAFSIFTACDFTSPINSEILVAQNFITSQQYQSAVTKYESILAAGASEELKIKIYYQLGELYSLHLSDNASALQYFRNIVKESEDPLWLIKAEEKIGDINFSFTRDYKSSLESYEKLSLFVPKLEKLEFFEFRKSLSLLHLGKLNEARTSFEKIKLSQDHEYNLKSYYYLGIISFQESDWQGAIKNLTEYIQREKRKDGIAQAKFLMANAYETMEDLPKAYNLYYSILGEYPNVHVVQNRLKAVYARRIARKR